MIERNDQRKEIPAKPLGQPAYGSIPHLPGSNLGPGDHHLNDGQTRICTQRARDRHDLIIVQEKLDGACTDVANCQGEIVALQRAGYPAETSPYPILQLFSQWVELRKELFRSLLNDGERLVGEWMPLAHGTRYALPGNQPWYVFDLMTGNRRAPYYEMAERLGSMPGAPPAPAVLTTGSTPVEWVQNNLGHGHHDALDPAEGAVWRVERKGQVDFLGGVVKVRVR